MNITAIGKQAFNHLMKESGGFIAGVTSAGVFIKTSTDKILFLTTQPYKGPLTLNLEGDGGILDRIENGMGVETGSGEISIPALAFRIQTSQADVWSPTLPQSSLRSPANRRETLHAFTGEILSLIKEQDYPAIYTQLKALSRGDTPPDPQPGSLFAAIHSLHQNIKAGNTPGTRESLDLLLGRGEGLTPAGDDLLLGWLLSLNRWREALAPDLDLQPLNQAILTAASEKTTAISASLLTCAAEGEADERLIAALDALMCEANIEGNVVKHLLSWGSSSGLYAFLGMIHSIIFAL